MIILYETIEECLEYLQRGLENIDYNKFPKIVVCANTLRLTKEIANTVSKDLKFNGFKEICDIDRINFIKNNFRITFLPAGDGNNVRGLRTNILVICADRMDTNVLETIYRSHLAINNSPIKNVAESLNKKVEILIENDWEYFNNTREKDLDTTPAKLFFYIGLPRSGKSTLAKKWQSKGSKRVVLNGDSFRKGVHGQIYIAESEFFVFACMDAAARALLNDGYEVLIGETSTSLSTIERYYRIDINAESIWVDTPKDVCIERAKSLNQDYLIPAIERIGKQFNELKIDFNEKINKIKRRILDRKSSDFIPHVEPKGV